MKRGRLDSIALAVLAGAVASLLDMASAHAAPGTPGAATASAEVPNVDPRGELRPPFALRGRFGMMSSEAKLTSGVALAPSVGLGVDWFFRRHVGLTLHYDSAFLHRGPESASVSRWQQQASAFMEGRLRIHRAASLRAGIGPGVSLVGITTRAGSSRTDFVFEPGFAWTGSFVVELPSTPLQLFLGAAGLAHRSSHDILSFVGVGVDIP